MSPSVEVPASHAALLGPPVVASLTTVSADGSLHSTAVWVTTEGDSVWVNTSRGRVKDRHMRGNPHVSLLCLDPANPYRYLSIAGVVEEVRDEDDPAHAAFVTTQIDAAAEAYISQRPYPFREEGEVRSAFRIRPVKVLVYG